MTFMQNQLLPMFASEKFVVESLNLLNSYRVSGWLDDDIRLFVFFTE